jgi:hypothetical protein
MAARTIINVESPKTQSIDAIKALLSWRERAADPLPSFVEMGSGEGRLVLVLSNKRDAYYTTTARDCSCPAHVWHPGSRCKHQRRFFPEEQQTNTITKPANHGAWHGANGPVAPEEIMMVKAAASSPSFEMVDTLPEPTDRDIAYHSIKADREMWPMVEA